MQSALFRSIKGGRSRKGKKVGCCPSRGSQHIARTLLVVLSFWALPPSVYATLDDAIRSALQTTGPYARQGYTVHEEDEWGGDLGVNERKAIRLTLVKGTDYWFCLSADLDSARVAIHVFDLRGRLAEVHAWQKGSHAGAEALSLIGAPYYIVIEVTDSPAERTHWAMVYASKPIGTARPLSAGKLRPGE